MNRLRWTEGLLFLIALGVVGLAARERQGHRAEAFAQSQARDSLEHERALLLYDNEFLQRSSRRSSIDSTVVLRG